MTARCAWFLATGTKFPTRSTRLRAPEQIRARFPTESEAVRALEERLVDARRGEHGDRTLTLFTPCRERLQLRDEARRIVEREFSNSTPGSWPPSRAVT